MSACPECMGRLQMDSMTTLQCQSCGERFRVADDGELIPVDGG